MIHARARSLLGTVTALIPALASFGGYANAGVRVPVILSALAAA
jgi:hypothetical protein